MGRALFPNLTPQYDQLFFLEKILNTEDKAVTVSSVEAMIIHLPDRPPAMLAKDLAEIYGVTTSALNQAVKRNAERFPADFMFQVTYSEKEILTSQSVIGDNVSQNPYLFTREGANQLSSVLRSPIAVERSIQIARAFTAIEQTIEKPVDSQPANVPKGLPEWAVEASGLKYVMDILKAPEHLVATEVTKRIFELDGPDLRNVVGVLPCSQDILEEDVYLEPTELGKVLGYSARKMNTLLRDNWLQSWKSKQWVASVAGKEMCVEHSWSKGSKSGYNLKWNVAKVVEALKAEKK